MLKEYLPDMAVVSVGHRSSIVSRHDMKLILSGDGTWTVERNS